MRHDNSICDLLFTCFGIFILVVEYASVIFILIYFDHNSFRQHLEAALSTVFIGLIITNCLSLYLLSWLGRRTSHGRCIFYRISMVLSHVLQVGLFWRYILSLFWPSTDLAIRNRQSAETALLRFLHAVLFCLPVCCNVYFVTFQTFWHQVPSYVLLCGTFLLFSTCYGLSLFSWRFVSLLCRESRNEDANPNFVLSWPGTLAQVTWRTGTLGARVIALTTYASVFGVYVVLVCALHWLTVVILVCLKQCCSKRPRMMTSSAPSPPPVLVASWRLWRTICLYFTISIMYIFDYVSLPKRRLHSSAERKVEKSRRRFFLTAYYLIMLAENSLLVLLWYRSFQFPYVDSETLWCKVLVFVWVWAGFGIGIFFMVIYFGLCHIDKLTSSTMTSCDEHGVNYTRSSSFMACRLPFGKKLISTMGQKDDQQRRSKKLPSKFDPVSGVTGVSHGRELSSLSQATTAVFDRVDLDIDERNHIQSMALMSVVGHINTSATPTLNGDAIGRRGGAASAPMRRKDIANRVISQGGTEPTASIDFDAPSYQENSRSDRKVQSVPKRIRQSDNSIGYPVPNGVMAGQFYEQPTSSSENDSDVVNESFKSSENGFKANVSRLSSQEILNLSNARDRQLENSNVVETIF